MLEEGLVGVRIRLPRRKGPEGMGRVLAAFPSRVLSRLSLSSSSSSSQLAEGKGGSQEGREARPEDRRKILSILSSSRGAR